LSGKEDQQLNKKTVLAGQKAFSEFYPGSIALITAVDSEGRADICTVGVWDLVNGKPPMYGIPLCNKDIDTRFFKRYTLICIEETGEFVINIPDVNLRTAWGRCAGVTLRKDINADKFAIAGITRAEPAVVKVPLIAECPINIECRVVDKLSLPCHDWIVGEAVAVHRAFEDNDIPMPIPVLQMADACAGKTRLS